MPEALALVFPATMLQTCIVHLVKQAFHLGFDSTRGRPQRDLGGLERRLEEISRSSSAI
jgi:hypothetical protein